jgi:hypothetical protein
MATHMFNFCFFGVYVFVCLYALFPLIKHHKNDWLKYNKPLSFSDINFMFQIWKKLVQFWCSVFVCLCVFFCVFVCVYLASLTRYEKNSLHTRSMLLKMMSRVRFFFFLFFLVFFLHDTENMCASFSFFFSLCVKMFVCFCDSYFWRKNVVLFNIISWQ